ncbi:cysteine-rich motor neuron 1 protein-like isoform X1 [Pomacea canaliculata]|uniref:cysteine-rich motor neuron 1 protein-like isoform X1 n=1 Tax=Pomacea canaliculata TaxID=400727 RepID=UPI000D73A3F9|nr:cysteine-rich motor neuron 1 protein-like isoform X1 [Pomacea canaliculata]
MLAPGQAQAASPPAFRPRVGRRQQGAGPHRHRHHHRTRRQLQNVTSGRSPSPWLVDKLTMTTAMVLLLLHNLAVVSALTCDLCRPSSCSPLRPDCPPGDVVLDVCGCCTVCARQVNESCGGVYGLLGRCADHLECFIAPPPVGQAITGHEEGVCKEISLFTCNTTDCDKSDTELCPPDSELVFSAAADVASYCHCNLSRCAVPGCATGFTPILVQQGTGVPGNCCDEHICIRLSACHHVTCPPVSEEECPQDSERLPPVWTDDGCCQVNDGCVCRRNEVCRPVECPSGFQIQVISRSTGNPGSCCTKFRCVNETGLTCIYENKEFQNGESWQIETCTTCTCKDGISRCRVSSCTPPPCGWMVIPEGQCCPVCKGCVSDSGGLYNNSDVWRENDCVTCQCQDGQVQCQAEMCASDCVHPKYIPGRCCPVCDEPDPLVTKKMCPLLENCSLDCQLGLDHAINGCVICQCKTESCDLKCAFGKAVDESGIELCQCNALPPRCPALEGCQKKCMYGYKIGRNGCEKCRCNRCPQFICLKKCLHGFMFSENGCQLCKCADAPSFVTPSLLTPNMSAVTTLGLSCMSSLGVRHEDGEIWDDGCRLCFCHNGSEMCSLLACPAPRCDNPVFRIGDCCPSCPGIALVQPGGERELCQSASGEYHVEGESWALDSCTQCLCHAGTVLCESPVCPPVLCHYPVKPAGTCCAVCKEESSLSISMLIPRPCKSSTGMVWQHGMVWRAGPCQSCSCQGGQVNCYSQVCPPLNCNKTVLRKGQCCPTCLDVHRPQVCITDGTKYSEGETFVASNCSQCLCKDGAITCTSLLCPHQPCSVMIRRRDQCCPVCYNGLVFPEDPPLNTSAPDGPIKTMADIQISTTETHVPVNDRSKQDNYVVGMAALGVLLSIALIAIVILTLILLRRRHTGKFKMEKAGMGRDTPMMTEVKIRPKSTNLELQGHMPLLDSPSKTINLEKHCYEKSALLLPMLTSDSLKLNDHYADGLNDEKTIIGSGNFISNNRSFEQV